MDDGKLLLNIDGTGTGVLGTHAHMHCIVCVEVTDMPDANNTMMTSRKPWRCNCWEAEWYDPIIASQGWFLILPIFWAFALNSEFYVANSLKPPVILHPSELTS